MVPKQRLLYLPFPYPRDYVKCWRAWNISAVTHPIRSVSRHQVGNDCSENLNSFRNSLIRNTRLMLEHNSFLFLLFSVAFLHTWKLLIFQAFHLLFHFLFFLPRNPMTWSNGSWHLFPLYVVLTWDCPSPKREQRDWSAMYVLEIVEEFIEPLLHTVSIHTR